MQNSNYKLIIGIIIILFTLIQILLIPIFGYTPYPDSNGYIELAKECIQNNSLYPISSKINDYPFLWNIGAINSVIISLKLFNSITPLLILYGFMKGATAYFFYKITKTIANDKTAFIALLIYILYPANYGEATSLLSELPFIFFISFGLWLSISLNLHLLGGMMLAIANSYRPFGIVFIISLFIYLIFINRKTIRPIIGYVIIIIILGTINYQRAGIFVYQAKTGWMALTDYSTNHSVKSMAIRDNHQWNVSQKDSAWQKLYIDWLKDHPKEYIGEMPEKFIKTYISDNVNMCAFIPDKNNNDYMYEKVSMFTLIDTFPNYSFIQWFTLLNLFYYYLLLLAALSSMRYFHCKTHLLSLLVIIIGTMMLLLVGHGEARFHQPFMPFIIIMAATLISK